MMDNATKGNPLLAQMKGDIAKRLPDKFDTAFLSLVTDGHKFMFSPQTKAKMDAKLSTISSPEQVPQVVGRGVMGIMALIKQQAKIPADLSHPFYPASVAAAQVLACDALEYIEQQKQIPVSKDLLAATIKAVTQAMMQLHGITEAIAKRAYDAAGQQQPPPSQPGKPPVQPPAGAA